ncbi:hypothetical protein BDZ91DRAFT_850147 [Kalaharituber pfeilii]|nr:hypothetical protein BDZ91DRAFT_850147 [Kalaharituber pfeilii]
MASAEYIRTAEEAVARVAYLASDVVISVKQSLSGESRYSAQLDSLLTAKTPSLIAQADESPEIQTIQQSADPLLSVHIPAHNGKYVSVTTTSNTLISAIPHLYKFANVPVVLHVAMEPAEFPDYADITSIRQSGLIMIQSESVLDAQDMAIAAHALAIRSGKGVLHFFPGTAAGAEARVPVADELLNRVLDQGKIRSFRAKATGQHQPTLYSGDGQKAETVDLPLPASSTPSTGAATPSASTGGLSGFLSGLTNGTPSSTSSETADSGNSSRLSVSSASTADSTTTVRAVTSEDIYNYAQDLFETIRQATSRNYRIFEYSGSPNATAAVFVFGSTIGLFRKAVAQAEAGEVYANVGVISARVYRPWFGTRIPHALPKSVTKVAVLEQIKRKTTRWGPLFLDLLTCLRSEPSSSIGMSVVGYQLGYIDSRTIQQALRGVVQNLNAQSPVQNLQVGSLSAPVAPSERILQPEVETAYMRILAELFKERLHLANEIHRANAGITEGISASPEYGFGSLIARQEKRQVFIAQVEKAIKDRAFATDVPAQLLSKWLVVANDPVKSIHAAQAAILRLEVDGSAASREFLRHKSFFYKESQWLVGSDAWSYDLDNSGVHHVLASGKNVNMLIIDSQPYSEKAAADAPRRKKDIGLYAMNYGNAYVASVAVYSSYTQVLHALIDADKFEGPSVVLAYLPYKKEDDSPLAILQETKKAVDIGYWPLYRWDPYGEEKGGINFNLDSERIKTELKEFLKRDNHLSQLIRRHPQFAANLSSSYGTEVREQQKRKAKDSFNKLLEGLSGPPLTILFASDGGNAESLAKRLARRGKLRGLKSMVMAMDDYPIDDLPNEENLVLVTSTGGQGEFPQNGRAFWEAVKNSTDIDLAKVNFAVFGLGDSEYWPRKEDKIYYNKPSKDLDKRLGDIGGKRMIDLGLGDDQDPDGYQTAYGEWEPKLWAYLGVDKVEGLADEPPPITNEDIKINSNYLRGTIMEGLLDESTGAISAADAQLTKFHGTYMQDDRDVRDERKAQGLEPAYSFMIRCRLPGGIATPDQYIRMDNISNEFANKTLKLTTRQTFQFHGVLKRNLRNSMRAINRACMDTLAACGDVNRNVMCTCLPENSALHEEVWKYSKKISEHLLPSTTAYHEIWIADESDKKTQVGGNAVVDFEPLYGPTYLPRKFKITIAIPPHNDTDVYAHDVGLVAIRAPDGSLEGFNVMAGGGMGVTHNNKKTYPRTGSMFGFVKKDVVHIVCEKIMLVQRDHGDRKDRKHARLKYTIDDMGVDVFKGKVEALLGFKFDEPRPFEFNNNADVYGWHRDEKGMNHFSMFIENGRIHDTPSFPTKTGLRELAKIHTGEFRLTGNQHLIVSNVTDEMLPKIKDLMAKYKLDGLSYSGLRLASAACVAFPTCGLAMAESERYLPELITMLESTLEECGLRHDAIVMRMTGCPNGCARPWLAEIGLVGKAYGAYNLYLGGGYKGDRLSKLYRSSIGEAEILGVLRPMLKRYALEREEGERFGDWVIRAGIVKRTTEGKRFHEDVAEEDEE